MADPKWWFGPWSHEIGIDRAADNRYRTCELTIKARACSLLSISQRRSAIRTSSRKTQIAEDPPNMVSLLLL
jgi:hypothetical protein